MDNVHFTVLVGGESFHAESRDVMLDLVQDWIDGPEPVSVLSSRDDRWEGPELTEMLEERKRALG